MPGMDNSAFNSTGWDKTTKSLLTWDTWAFDQTIFKQRGQSEINAGDDIRFGIEYSTTDNGTTLVPWQSLAAPDTVDGISATFTKSSYTNSGITDQVLQAREKGANQLVDLSSSLISDEKMIRTAVLNMKARMTAALILEAETQIDSSGTFSDSARSRSVYGLASYEDTDGGGIKLQQLEDGIEALESSTYGNCTNPETELLICLPRNQLTNLARAGAASAGVSFNETNFFMSADSQSMAPIDAGRITRTKTFEGIQLQKIPGMTTTVILLIRRDTCSMDMWQDVILKEIAVAGFQRQIACWAGCNFVCWKPSWNGKISGLDA